jgi:hypothetical protein
MWNAVNTFWKSWTKVDRVELIHSNEYPYERADWRNQLIHSHEQLPKFSEHALSLLMSMLTDSLSWVTHVSSIQNFPSMLWVCLWACSLIDSVESLKWAWRKFSHSIKWVCSWVCSRGASSGEFRNEHAQKHTHVLWACSLFVRATYELCICTNPRVSNFCRAKRDLRMSFG